MADADGRVQVDEGGVARGCRIAVGHADHHRFLQAEHVLEVGRETEEQRQLGRAGVAEDAAHAEGAQQLQDGVADRRRVGRPRRRDRTHVRRPAARAGTRWGEADLAQKTRLKCAMSKRNALAMW